MSWTLLSLIWRCTLFQHTRFQDFNVQGFKTDSGPGVGNCTEELEPEHHLSYTNALFPGTKEFLVSRDSW